MESSERHVHDVVGIGFGPANLALAIALEECEEPVSAAFFERQPSLGWHRGMLVPSAKMQVAFLKDLVTFRNPVSGFSFVAYLKEMDRLVRFVNNQDFFPTRQEFHAYLDWAAARLAHRVSYRSEVTAVRLPERGHGHAELTVRNLGTGTSRVVAARNVVVSTGLVPRMPAGLVPDENVWHSSEFMHRFRECDRGRLRRVAVAGAGQSAAEIVRFLYDTLPEAEVVAVVPSYGYSLADSTPFANQIFDPAAVDDFYAGSADAKEAIWQYHRNTNYSVADDEVIKDLYQRLYDQDLAGGTRLSFVNLTRVADAKQVADETRVTLSSLADDRSYEIDVDVLVCATGYGSMDPSEVLGDLDRYCVHDEVGRYRVDRDYRLVTPDLDFGIYLQGGTEHTHGITSSLLSNVAVRAGDIVRSITSYRTAAAGKERSA